MSNRELLLVGVTRLLGGNDEGANYAIVVIDAFLKQLAIHPEQNPEADHWPIESAEAFPLLSE